ncbi:hypothetical protein [Methanocaldococcus infernus]
MEVAIKIYPKEFLTNEVIDNYLIINGKKIKKVRILGYVEGFEGDYVIVDKVKVKMNKEGVNKDDLLDVIGYVKNDNDRYIEAELVRKRGRSWILLRELEIRATRKYLDKIPTDEDIEKKVLEIIKRFGELTFDDISKMVKIPEDKLKEILEKLEGKGEILYMDNKYIAL